MFAVARESSVHAHHRSSARAHAVTARRTPALRHRVVLQGPFRWPGQTVATHYFDAATHSAMTLRTVLNAQQDGARTVGRPGQQQLVNAVNTLVSATCPQGGMDSESHAYFSMLLNRHLSGLEPDELAALARALKSAGYDSVSEHAARQLDIYDAFGFVTGKAEDVGTLPPDWHHLLDAAIAQAAAVARRPLAGKSLSESEASAARQCLTDAALAWPLSAQSMTDIVGIARRLSDAIGLSPAPRVGCTAKATPRGSLLDWKEDVLLVDLKSMRALSDDRSGQRLPELLRDLLELLVARKMFGDGTHPSRLCSADRIRLQKGMNDVQAAAPCVPALPLRQAAARVLAQAGSLGTVQVLPTIGVALGHAWIGGTLSVLPDTSQRPVEIGTRYMHPGFQLEPDDCRVLQWPIRWLDADDSARIFRDEHAWQVTVPVERERLEHAAAAVATDWKSRAVPYRFIGAEADMPSSGCRSSVLQAIQRGMDDDARALFDCFNAGLAEPESPTELALRMSRFMQWLQSIAFNAQH